MKSIMLVLFLKPGKMIVAGMLRIVRVGIRVGVVRKDMTLERRGQGVQQCRSTKAVRQLNQFRRKHFQSHDQPVVPVNLHIEVRDDVVVRHPALREAMVLVGDLLKSVSEIEREVLLLRVQHQRQLVAALYEMHQLLVLLIILRLEGHLVLLHLDVSLSQLITQHLKRLRQILLVEHRKRGNRSDQEQERRQSYSFEYSHFRFLLYEYKNSKYILNQHEICTSLADQIDNCMRTFHSHRRIVLAFALFACLSALSQAQERKIDTLQRIESKDTLLFQPLFSENAAGLKVVRMTDSPYVRNSKMEMDRDGNVWKVFTADGLDVLMNVRYLKHYGQYYRLDLYIQNNTDRPVKYDFKNTSVASRMGPVKVFRQRGYLNRIGAQKTAKTIGIGIGTLFVTFVMAAIVRGDPDDRDSLAEDLLRDLGGTAIEEAGFIATMAMADSESEDMARIERSCIGYLGDYTIRPRHAIEGHAYAKYKKGADSIEITLPIGDKKYVFNWDTTSLVNITEDL